MTDLLITFGFPIVVLVVAIYSCTIGAGRADRRRREHKRLSDQAWLAQVEEWNAPADHAPHRHGAWCHPSADGCPDDVR